MSVRGRRAGSARTTLFVCSPGPLKPARARAPGSAGMRPPFEAIATRLLSAPAATIAMPRTRDFLGAGDEEGDRGRDVDGWSEAIARHRAAERGEEDDLHDEPADRE